MASIRDWTGAIIFSPHPPKNNGSTDKHRGEGVTKTKT